MDGELQYRWVGLNQTGQTVQGLLYAKNITLAKITLHQQGIQVHKIKRLKPLKHWLHLTRIKPSDITQLTRQLAHLMHAQMPLLQALELLKLGESNPRLRGILDNLKADLQQGLSLADACQKYPVYFHPVFCHMIRAGERSGTLVIALKQLVSYQEARDTLKQKIKKSLAYPLTILSIAAVVTTGLLQFVVPEFQSLFQSFDATLPRATQCLISCSHLLKTYGLQSMMFLFLCVYTIKYAYKHDSKIQFLWDLSLIKAPFIGAIIQSMIVTRLTQALGMLLSGGLPLIDALGLSTTLVHNLPYQKAMLHTQTAVKEGHPLQRTLENTGLFPSLLTQMVGMGEASGQLVHLLNQFAVTQHEQLTHQLDVLSHLFEPILMAILGLWIGGLIVALYLPIFQLGAIVS